MVRSVTVYGGMAAMAWCLLTAAAARAEEPSRRESLPQATRLAALEVFPEQIELTHRYDYRQLLVTAVTEEGQRIDATRMVSASAPGKLVSISPGGLVRAVGDGRGEVKLSLAGQSLRLPVRVSGTAAEHEVSFVREVQPALSKLACNQGTCHGAQQGKNGFKLSLRGYDPLFDHRALTDDLAGRRFNRAAPEQSLMLLKPAGGVPHVGGVLMKPGEPYYELLREWIAQGVQFDPESPRVAHIEVLPQDPIVPLPGRRQQMVVMAHYTDGSQRDVTAEAFLESSLSEVVELDRSGLATAVRRGEAAVLARYEGAYAATTIVVMGDRSGFEWTDPPANNHIDELVYQKLQQVKVLPSELCTDSEFIRRVYLDLTGLPPQPDEVRAFLADSRETRLKRDELIDRLVGSPEYVEHWTNKWADMLQVNRKFLGEEGAWALRNWIRQAVATNMPYDEFVYQVLTASGSTLENPPAAYYKVLRDPGGTMENTTQLFLAVRFNCNKCHDHPFERWTQDQYYHLAAYFAQVGRKPAPAYAGQQIGGTAVEAALAAVEMVYDQTGGEVTHDRTGAVAPPEFPYQQELVDSAESASRREQLARWITSPENQYFAKSYVNRIWSYLLGTGIIEPVDDIRAGNPPSNPALLDRLTADFLASGFNVQELIRTICKSRVYQHSVETNRWNEDDQLNYSHAKARRLPAETLYDAVHAATGTTPRLPGTPVGFRASQTADSGVKLSDGFLELFGRPARESACECERSTGVMLGQALNLVNGPTVAEAIAAPNNRIARLIDEHADDRRVVEELFLAILCRPPTAAETAAALAALEEAAEELAQHAEALDRYQRDTLPARQAAWEQQFAPPQWQPLEVTSAEATSGAPLEVLDDGSILVGGNPADKDDYTIELHTDLRGITALRLEVLTDKSLTRNGPGRAGNFVLNELTLAVAAGDGADAVNVPLANAQADFSQANYEVAKAIDGNPGTGWAVSPEIGKPHVATFETATDVGGDTTTRLTVKLVQQFGRSHTLGRFRLSATRSPRPIRLTSDLPAPIAAALAVPRESRSAEQQKLLDTHYRGVDEPLQRLQALAQPDQDARRTARLLGAQDLAWALVNSPAFLFNR